MEIVVSRQRNFFGLGRCTGATFSVDGQVKGRLEEKSRLGLSLSWLLQTESESFNLKLGPLGGMQDELQTSDGKVNVSAHHPTGAFTIDFAGRSYKCLPESTSLWNFVVSQEQNEVGRVTVDSLSLPKDWPLTVQMFLYLKIEILALEKASYSPT